MNNYKEIIGNASNIKELVLDCLEKELQKNIGKKFLRTHIGALLMQSQNLFTNEGDALLFIKASPNLVMSYCESDYINEIYELHPNIFEEPCSFANNMIDAAFIDILPKNVFNNYPSEMVLTHGLANLYLKKAEQTELSLDMSDKLDANDLSLISDNFTKRVNQCISEELENLKGQELLLSELSSKLSINKKFMDYNFIISNIGKAFDTYHYFYDRYHINLNPLNNPTTFAKLMVEKEISDRLDISLFFNNSCNQILNMTDDVISTLKSELKVQEPSLDNIIQNAQEKVSNKQEINKEKNLER